MTSDLDMLVRRYLDGELSLERESEVLRRIAEDDDARALLRLELQVRAQGTSDVKVPDGFAGRTMAVIEAAETESEAPSLSLGALIEAAWRWLAGPRTVRVRPGFVAASVVLIAATAISLWPMPTSRLANSGPVATATDAPPTTAVAQEEVVWTRFMYANDEAASVAVAGDFSGWEPIPLSAETVDGQTVWTGLVPVSKGEHQYMFVVDGSRWVTDPLAPVQRSDGFGNKNAVLQL